jgi:trans-aconitate methyltransferase
MTAVDFSGVAVERGRARSEQVDFIQADVFDWQPERTFDLVLIAYLQVEADRLAALLERVKDWLEPGAELFRSGTTARTSSTVSVARKNLRSCGMWTRSSVGWAISRSSRRAWSTVGLRSRVRRLTPRTR